VLNLLFPLTLAMLTAARRGAARGLLMILVGLEVAGIVVTFSRGGFLTLLVSVAIYAFKRARDGRGSTALWTGALLLLALVAIPMLPAGYLERIATIPDIEADKTGSSRVRWDDSITAARLVLANPVVGAGMGADILALNAARGPAWREVHNAY